MQICLRGRRARVCTAAGVAGVLGFVLGVPAVAVAAATPADKVPLTQTNRGCDGAVLDGERSQPFGFVQVVRPASGKLVASVALKGAPAHTTYHVRLIQVLPDAGDCGSSTVYDGTLTTDDEGDGNINVQEPVLPGATAVWVDLNNASDFSDFFDAEPLPL